MSRRDDHRHAMLLERFGRCEFCNSDDGLTTVTIHDTGCASMDCDDQPCTYCNATGLNLDPAGYLWYRFSCSPDTQPLYRFTNDAASFVAACEANLGGRWTATLVGPRDCPDRLAGEHACWHSDDACYPTIDL